MLLLSLPLPVARESNDTSNIGVTLHGPVVWRIAMSNKNTKALAHEKRKGESVSST